jgi:hypothetical protein
MYTLRTWSNIGNENTANKKQDDAFDVETGSIPLSTTQLRGARLCLVYMYHRPASWATRRAGPSVSVSLIFIEEQRGKYCRCQWKCQSSQEVTKFNRMKLWVISWRILNVESVLGVCWSVTEGVHGTLYLPQSTL